MANDRKELFVTDMAEIFEPKSNISEIGAKNKWRSVRYATTDHEGTILSAVGNAVPDDVSYDPQLEGWYKIYILMPAHQGTRLFIKLEQDEAFLMVHNQRLNGNYVEEFLWRCADMTGEKVTITRRKLALEANSLISGLRFVPMTDEEVAEWKREDARTDTKCIYTTDDMHNRPYITKIETIEDWVATVLPFRHTDAEWFSVEDIRLFAEGECPTAPDDYAFNRKGDRWVQKQALKFDYDEVLRRITEKGHEIGLKMSVSTRMGAWGMMYPYDQCYFDCAFHADHPEWRCIDKNGDVISALSYAYEGVRKYMVDYIVNMARSGCDAVTLIAHRGIPYVHYEKPVADKFFELYGEYPYELPLDDPRLNELHCDIMTGFFREVRKALDKEFGKDKVEIHLRGQFSLHDNKYIGLDCERLAAEGLINAVVSYPQRHHELIPDWIRKEGDPAKIDLEKYTQFVNGDAPTVFHSSDINSLGPYKNSRGEDVGPATQADRLAEWNAFEDKYGVKVYIDILPREMLNDEFKRRVCEIYDLGARRIALWDTYSRVWNQPMWNIVSRFGHKDEIKDMPTHEDGYRNYKFLHIADTVFKRYNPMWGG